MNSCLAPAFRASDETLLLLRASPDKIGKRPADSRTLFRDLVSRVLGPVDNRVSGPGRETDFPSERERAYVPLKTTLLKRGLRPWLFREEDRRVRQEYGEIGHFGVAKARKKDKPLSALAALPKPNVFHSYHAPKSWTSTGPSSCRDKTHT